MFAEVILVLKYWSADLKPFNCHVIVYPAKPLIIPEVNSDGNEEVTNNKTSDARQSSPVQPAI